MLSEFKFFKLDFKLLHGVNSFPRMISNSFLQRTFIINALVLYHEGTNRLLFQTAPKEWRILEAISVYDKLKRYDSFGSLLEAMQRDVGSACEKQPTFKKKGRARARSRGKRK